MRILGLVAENYKRLKLIEVAPKSRVVTFSGKPDQGKTSCVDAFLAAIGGKRFTADMPVRKGAKNARIRLVLGSSKVEWTVQRTIRPGGEQELVLTDASGRQQGRGQSILDDLIGDIWMDPTAFVRMKPKEQIEILRKIANVPDFTAMEAANAADFAIRTELNREIKGISFELQGMTVQDGLPEERVDETPFRERMAAAKVANENVQEIIVEKTRLRGEAQALTDSAEQLQRTMNELADEIDQLEARLVEVKGMLSEAEKDLPKRIKSAETAHAAYDAAPAGEIVDVSGIVEELEQAQLTNREIDKREVYLARQRTMQVKQREADALTRAMADRQEEKTLALDNAKLPVEGLTFDDNLVYVKGIPLAQLGESEQIQICTRIAMAEEKPLRVLPVMHGESLGDSGIAMLEKLAEEHDFQILMAMVDDSGKRGYVIEDGMVARDNEA